MDACTPPIDHARAIAIRQKENEEAAYHRQAQRLVDDIFVLRASLQDTELCGAVHAFLAAVGTVHERAGIKRHAVDLILRQDKVTLCLACFDQNALDVWVMSNTQYAVEHCPESLAVWLSFGSFGKGLILANLAMTLRHLSERELATILVGSTGNKMHDMVRTLLLLDPELWKTLSPAWIGAKGSYLRELATALGWTTAMLPMMLFSHIWRNPEPWIEYLPFPYSITVCKWILDVEQYGVLYKDSESYFVTSVAMVVNANAFDVALAQALLQTTKLQVSYQFDQHPNVPAPDAQMMQVVSAVLGMYNAHSNVEALMHTLCHGELCTAGTESYSVEQLV